MDNEHYRETYKILAEIGQKEMKINKELGIVWGKNLLIFLGPVLQNVDEFPSLKYFEIPPSKVTITARPQPFAYGIRLAVTIFWSNKRI